MNKKIKKVLLISALCVIIAALVSGGLVINNKLTALNQKVKVAKMENNGLINELGQANKKINENNNLISDLEKSNEELMDLTSNSFNNLFMGTWKVTTISYRGRPVTDKMVNEIMAECNGQVFTITDKGFSFLGNTYNKFTYETYFINTEKQSNGIEDVIPFKVNGKKTDYLYYSDIYGYKDGKVVYMEYIIMEDENNAHLSYTTSGDSTVYLKLERVGKIPS